MSISTYSIFPFLGALSLFFILIFVIFKNRTSAFNKAFSMFLFYTFNWLLMYSISYSINARDLVFLLLKIGYSTVIFMPIGAVHFAMIFLKLSERFRKLIIFGYIISFFFLISLWATNFFVSGLYEYFWGHYPKIGILHPFFMAFFALSVSFIIVLLIKERIKVRKGESLYKYKLQYLMIAFISVCLAGVDFIPNYGIEIYPFGWVLILIFSYLVTYAILKYQLMDIKVVIKKAFFYSVGIAIASGFIVIISFLSNWFSENIPGFEFWTVPLIAGTTAFIVGNIFWRKSKEVDKLKYEFITIAAHKLRTPLTEVKWGLEALSSEIKDTGKKLLKDVVNSNSRTIELTDELLSVSRADTDQIKYQFESVGIEKVARVIVNDYQHQMKEKNIKLTYNIEQNLPKVNADKTRISSVIQILLENAIAYTKDRIAINIDAYKDNVIFHIEDNGIGILKEDQPYIFSKFFRSKEAYLSETEGSGLSLFLAKSMIDKHNGKIGVRSEGKGRGSTFWFGLKAV